MKNLRLLLVPIVLGVLPLSSWADKGKDESGHGRHHGHERREFKEEYWDGNCKVEREYKKNGEYKEERKCKGNDRHSHYAPAPVYVVPAPAPVYVVPAPAVVVEPGVRINGTIRISN